MRMPVWRWPLLLLALSALAMFVVGCSFGPSAQPLSNTNNLAITTPNPALLTPTPTFPPFTVGTWPSTYSPANAATVTIYVICRTQSASMSGPSIPPPAGLAVSIQVGSPINQADSGTTDADGMAAVPVTFTDPQSGTPVTVQVTVNYNGATYGAETFFTPNPAAKPTPTPTPQQTPSPAATAPAPSPAATAPAPSPAATAGG